MNSIDNETRFKAYMVRKDEEGFRAGIEELTLPELPNEAVTIQVEYSSVNYKDGLASTENGKVVRSYPIIPGIDLAGTVVSSADDRFKQGDKVLATGYGLGVQQDGGYSPYAKLPADWLIPLPEGLTTKEAMSIGTAGFTAAMSVEALLQAGVTREMGPILVAGASGGVGSMAISILAQLGFDVIASTGKKDAEEQLLKQLGATEVITREDAYQKNTGALSTERFAGVIDPVGGSALNAVLASVKYGGAVAISGMTGGNTFESTVFPFILRGVSLVGIDSVYCPRDRRLKLWRLLGKEWKPETALVQGVNEIFLEELPQTLSRILEGRAVGRSVVRLNSVE
ncbi:acryloyl-CoA reductase [Paenibacillus sp. PDC88]|uniref:acrylyl-CoA reductase family protein n=1 Tax=Paenibacillus sp. PDC88 TaxID=1884375 RepID=UPI000894E977|nr:acryloyl-CoA reductase [Paenibacillus sp. PDC88]SDW13990.1 putative quinone oxidoreductase, YhdH/YhfP family [Paenibacillus sp. PDC88]